MSYTPGPWKAMQHPDPDCAAISIGGADFTGDDFASGFATVYINTADNALLLAAAPELLEALTTCVKELKAWVKDHGEDRKTRDAIGHACAAIAKARGES